MSQSGKLANMDLQKNHRHYMRIKTQIALLCLSLMAQVGVGHAAEEAARFQGKTCDLDTYVHSALERCNLGDNAICP